MGNFSGRQFVDADYKMAQMTSVGIFVIGIIFLEHGLAPYMNQYIAPVFTGKATNSIPDSPLFFTITSAFARLIVVPLTLIIALLTFGSNNTMIQILCTLFLVLDPT